MSGRVTRRRDAWMGAALAAAAAGSWGCWSLVLRPAALTPLLSSVVVMAVMGLILAPLASADGLRPRWDRATVGLLVLHSALDALNIVTFFEAFTRTTIAVAVLSHYLAPLLVAIVSPMLGGARIRGSVLAALVALAGLALVLQPWSSRLSSSDVAGALLGAVSAIGYAGNVILAGRLVPRIGATRTVGYHAIVSAVLLLPLLSSADVEAATREGVLLVAGGAVVMGGLAGWMFVQGLRRVGGTTASMVAFCEPLVAVTVGVVAWDEKLGPLAIVGAVLVLGAGAFVTWRVATSDAPTGP